MNNLKIYFNIIRNAKKLSETRMESDLYYESHHIKPKSLGGSNKKRNLVLLTPKEHFICHLLLHRFFKKNKISQLKMTRAFIMMKSKNASQQKRYLNSRLYDTIRKSIYDNGTLSGENAIFYGKKHTKESREKISIARTKNNGMSGKIPWNKGLTKKTSEKVAAYGSKQSSSKIGNVKHSEETKTKISKKLKGVQKKPFTAEHRAKISEAMQARKYNPETYAKIREKTKGIPKEVVTCPYCAKSGGISAMTRWHFEKCKEKPDV